MIINVVALIMNGYDAFKSLDVRYTSLRMLLDGNCIPKVIIVFNYSL